MSLNQFDNDRSNSVLQRLSRKQAPQIFSIFQIPGSILGTFTFISLKWQPMSITNVKSVFIFYGCEKPNNVPQTQQLETAPTYYLIRPKSAHSVTGFCVQDLKQLKSRCQPAFCVCWTSRSFAQQSLITVFIKVRAVFPCRLPSAHRDFLHSSSHNLHYLQASNDESPLCQIFLTFPIPQGMPQSFLPQVLLEGRFVFTRG